MTSLLDELRWLERVTEDDATNVYGRAADNIDQLVEGLKEARSTISGLECQFDHQGCTCTFPSDDCCSFATIETRLTQLSALIASVEGGE